MTDEQIMQNANEINRIRHLLKCSIEEAIDVIEQDKLIESGKPTYFDLSKEQAKVAIKEAQKNMGHQCTTRNRERKVDSTKQGLLAGCKDLLIAEGCDITSEKTETEIAFTYNGENYTLKLTKHRKKKGE